MNRNTATSALVPLLVSVAAVIVAFAAGALVVAASGESPTEAGRALWDGAFGGGAQLGGTLSKTIPLLLVALGWIVAYRSRRVNIGFEGQILVGGVFATLAGTQITGLPAVVHLPLAVVAGIVGGALWVAIAAVLWARRGVNEIIVTLMLNFVAIQIVSWLVRGPLQEPTGNFTRSMPMESSARWPRLIDDTSLSWDFLVALAMTLVIWAMLNHTTFGFRLRFTGSNEEAARHGGIATRNVTVAAFLLSGGLAGLAGSSLILGGETSSMADNFSANYGFEGIVVALLARNHPLGCLPAALLFAVLRQGGGLMEARAGVSSQIVLLVQGIVILVVAASAYLSIRRRRVRIDAAAPRGDLRALVGDPSRENG